MLFSVIIPSYNRAALLSQTLDSVFAQTFTDYEIIVVDDGSTDDTYQRLESLKGRVQVFTQTNRGPGAARNLGARQAKGDYLAFLDSDDIFFPWALEVYRDAIEQNQRPSFVTGMPVCFHQQSELDRVIRGEPRLASFPDYLASGDEWRWWGVSSFVVRKDAYAAVGGFADDWINGEDADLALRLGVSPGFTQVVTPPAFGYREHAVSAVKNLDRSIDGMKYKICAEKEGRYPGGPARSHQRWQILTRHIRPVSLACLREGKRLAAWELYRDMFRWHVSLGRWKYLAAFWFFYVYHVFSRPAAVPTELHVQAL